MTSQQVVTNAVRKTTLISRHGLALRVTDNAVNGSESVTGDANTILEMMSVAPGEIVLRGESANRYIGMDNNGNLIAYNSLMEDCVFKEHLHNNGYMSFESRLHNGWYLALRNDGRAKPGPKTAPGQRAVEFLPGKI